GVGHGGGVGVDGGLGGVELVGPAGDGGVGGGADEVHVLPQRHRQAGQQVGGLAVRVPRDLVGVLLGDPPGHGRPQRDHLGGGPPQAGEVRPAGGGLLGGGHRAGHRVG